MSFVAGIDKFASWTSLSGGLGVAVVLNITGWSWKELIDLIDITHTAAGGVQTLLGSVLRGDGTVKGFHDTANAWWASVGPLIRSGTLGVIRYNVGMTNPWQIPARVSGLNNQSAVAGGVEVDFTVRLDSTAGSYAYPS